MGQLLRVLLHNGMQTDLPYWMSGDRPDMSIVRLASYGTELDVYLVSSPNNFRVRFRGRPRRMGPKSSSLPSASC